MGIADELEYIDIYSRSLRYVPYHSKEARDIRQRLDKSRDRARRMITQVAMDNLLPKQRLQVAFSLLDELITSGVIDGESFYAPVHTKDRINKAVKQLEGISDARS